MAQPQSVITPINNTLGIFFHEKGSIKISNSKWTLLVYKELSPIKDAISNNDRILNQIYDNFIYDETPRMKAFQKDILTHVSLIKQISESVNLKYREIFADTMKYYYRKRRGILNGLGTIWKSITGNLDASDGDYFNECINRVSRDEREIETLMKNQISVTTSVIKNFNATIQNLQIDEQTFNKDIEEIHKSLMDISDLLAFNDAQIKVLDLCETLMESYTFIENFLSEIINSIAFARLGVLHSSIINPLDLLNSLKEISQSLQKTNLPLPVYSSYIARYIDLIELEAYQSDTKIVFVLKIPLIEPESYTLYRVYPIPILDNHTEFHHIIPITRSYIARDDDSMLYVTPQDLKKCKNLNINQKICPDLLPYPIDSDSICEAQLLRRTTSTLPKTCQVSLLYASDYNVEEIDSNLWLISISGPLPVTIKCIDKEVITKIIKTNSLLKLQPRCSSFIGSTRVQAKYLVDKHENLTYKSSPVQIPFKCCEHMPAKSAIPQLKPLRLNKINTDDLKIAQHKLDHYSEELDKMIHQPFIERNMSWFIILTICVVISLMVLYAMYKCRRKRFPRITAKPADDDDDPQLPPTTPLQGVTKKISRSILPKRRPSFRARDLTEELELSEA